MLAQRITYVGELGYELYVAPEWAAQVWDALWVAGAEHGIEPGGYRVLESLRMEKGYRYMGTDISAGDTPYEAGLGFCVALDKGDFVGRDALAAAAARPAATRRCARSSWAARTTLPLYGGEAVRLGGQTAGRVRSCAYGYTVRRNIAYAYLPAGATAGAALEVEVLGEPVAAEVAADVLYDPGTSACAADTPCACSPTPSSSRSTRAARAPAASPTTRASSRSRRPSAPWPRRALARGWSSMTRRSCSPARSSRSPRRGWPPAASVAGSASPIRPRRSSCGSARAARP